ncbi:MAG: DUF512 domain-containing protein [Chloroflexi bacterium]|nr:DUF512 domain-containing protein [Chloroflexota bacterium]
MKPTRGGRIARVEPGSLAATAGLQAGEVLHTINGHVLRDVIDYQFYSAEEELHLKVQAVSGRLRTVHISRGYDQGLGLDFATPTFDGIRRCRNRCDFCFIQQMPPGLRKSLYVKDDDYRYSFLFGNFITLTNLDEDDWARLGEQRLSPLYVSVHATDPQLRARILGQKEASDILVQIRRLGSLGVKVHAQIVVTPGLNDGPVLERSVQDLAGLYPTVASIAVVPVGLTRYHCSGLRTPSPAEAQQILKRLKPLQWSYHRQHGVRLVYAADELYLLAEQPVPGSATYGGFPQLSNGVGLTRRLLDDWQRRKRRGPPSAWPYHKVTLVCGALIAPVLSGLAREVEQWLGVTVRVVPVTNRFFGPTVTVSGLLVAQDVLEQLRDRDLGELVVLPRAMFEAESELTIDDRRREDIEQQFGVRVSMAERMSEWL